MADVSAERLELIRYFHNLPETIGSVDLCKAATRDLLAMIDARDRELVALREVIQSLQQEGSGRLRYD